MIPSTEAAAKREPQAEVAWPRMVVYTGIEAAERNTIFKENSEIEITLVKICRKDFWKILMIFGILQYGQLDLNKQAFQLN